MSRQSSAKFVPCDYCGGLFSSNVIVDHEGKCVEATVSNSRTLKTEDGVRSRRNSVGSRKSTRAEPLRDLSSPKEPPPPSRSSNDNRPNTTTISSRRSRSLNSREGDDEENARPARGMPGSRVCFVCGQRFSKNSLEPHEKKCLHFWEVQVSQLPKMFKCNKPLKWAVPSVDGTVDEERLAKMSAVSAKEAQSVFCLKCKDGGVALTEAKEHAHLCRGKKGNQMEKERLKQAENDYKHGAGLFNTLY